MIKTIPRDAPGPQRRAADGPSSEEIDDAWDQYDEEQEGPDATADRQQSTIEPVVRESLDDIFRQLKEELPEPASSQAAAPIPSFGDYVAQEQARQALDRTAEVKSDRMVTGALEATLQAESHRRELRQDCPSFWVNKNLANCPEIRNDTELKCLGLLNILMRKHGYAYASNEQLAVWMRLKSAESMRHLLARLSKRGLIQNTGRRHDEIRWVVREDLRNPKKGGS